MAGNGHGGKREGAGRKRKPAPIATDYDAEGYLEAVVAGREAADPDRIAAARTLIGYQRARARARIPSPPAKAMAERQAAAGQRDADAEWESKKAAIIAKHAAKRGT